MKSVLTTEEVLSVRRTLTRIIDGDRERIRFIPGESLLCRRALLAGWVTKRSFVNKAFGPSSYAMTPAGYKALVAMGGPVDDSIGI
jgi:hypothetical protein